MAAFLILAVLDAMLMPVMAAGVYQAGWPCEPWTSRADAPALLGGAR